MKYFLAGFYWARFRNGDGELFVVERCGQPLRWEMPGSEVKLGDEDVEICSDRLVPPHAKVMS